MRVPVCIFITTHSRGFVLVAMFFDEHSNSTKLCRIAGSETSSTAMTFTLRFLVQNPDKLIKLREELDLAAASNAPGTLPSYDQVRSIPYLTGCINESFAFALSPPLGFLER